MGTNKQDGGFRRVCLYRALYLQYVGTLITLVDRFQRCEMDKSIGLLEPRNIYRAVLIFCLHLTICRRLQELLNLGVPVYDPDADDSLIPLSDNEKFRWEDMPQSVRIADLR